jgi:hypothetical protein
MKMVRIAIVALVCGVLLASCSLWPFGSGVVLDDSHARADARMEQIAAAVNNGDAAALKALFSTRALDEATDIEAGIEYFLSFFPDGELAWERDAIGSEGENDGYGNKTRMLRANYKLFVDGEEYWLHFADSTVDTRDPDNVGLYALALTSWTDDIHSDAAEPFSAWVRANHPGVYVPAERD